MKPTTLPEYCGQGYVWNCQTTVKMLAGCDRSTEIIHGIPKPTCCRIYGEQIHKYDDKMMLGYKMTAFPKLVKLYTYTDASSSQVILHSICCVLPIIQFFSVDTQRQINNFGNHSTQENIFVYLELEQSVL